MSDEVFHVIAKLALPALITLLWLYRQHLAERRPPPPTDEVPFERQYERLEPASSQPDYVRGAGDVILRYHDKAWLGLLLFGVVIGIVAVKEPMPRAIFAITGIVLVLIVVVWRLRESAARRRRARSEDPFRNEGPGGPPALRPR